VWELKDRNSDNDLRATGKSAQRAEMTVEETLSSRGSRRPWKIILDRVKEKEKINYVVPLSIAVQREQQYRSSSSNNTQQSVLLCCHSFYL